MPRWLAELASYDDFPEYPGPDIGPVDEVATWLDAHRPDSWRPGILHGDYHAANVMFSPDGPDVAAVVDWEMCTIGDPLLDLGWLLATWELPGAPEEFAGPLTRAGGLATDDELVQRYAERSARDLSAIDWYVVLACFKLGIILEGTHARALAGLAPDGHRRPAAPHHPAPLRPRPRADPAELKLGTEGTHDRLRHPRRPRRPPRRGVHVRRRAGRAVRDGPAGHRRTGRPTTCATSWSSLARKAGLLTFQAEGKDGSGITHLEQAILFEAAGWSSLGPVALNCAAPDEGNMFLLDKIASAGAGRGVPLADDRGLPALGVRDDRARRRRAPTRASSRRRPCATATATSSTA